MPQLIRDFFSLVMLADGASAGIEQAINRALFILLLLPHHRAVLPTGIAAVLWCDTVAVFGDVAIGMRVIAAQNSRNSC